MDSMKQKAYDDELRREELLSVFLRFQNDSYKVQCMILPNWTWKSQHLRVLTHWDWVKDQTSIYLGYVVMHVYFFFVSKVLSNFSFGYNSYCRMVGVDSLQQMQRVWTHLNMQGEQPAKNVAAFMSGYKQKNKSLGQDGVRFFFGP